MIVVARARADVLDAPRQLLDPHDRQRGEHADAAQQRVLGARGPARTPPGAAARASGRARAAGSTMPTASSAPRRPNSDHEHRREQRAEPGREPVRPLDHAERARQHRVRGQPLHQRQPGDLDHRVADAEHDEPDHRDADRRHRAQHEQRDADAQAAEHQPGRVAPARDQHRGRRPADHAADAPGRVQPADAGGAELKQLQRDQHDEHVDRALDQRLTPSTPTTSRRSRSARTALEALEAISRRGRARVARRARRSAGMPAKRHGGQREHGRRRAQRQLDAAQRDEQAAEQRARRRTRRCRPRSRARWSAASWPRVVGQHRQQRGLRRLVAGSDRGEHRGEREHRRGRTARPHQRGAAGEHARAREAQHEQHVAARVAVAQQAHRRCGERRGRHPHERGDADRRRSAHAVRIDRQRDEERPSAERGGDPRGLQPPQWAASRARPETPPRRQTQFLKRSGDDPQPRSPYRPARAGTPAPAASRPLSYGVVVEQREGERLAVRARAQHVGGADRLAEADRDRVRRWSGRRR